MLKWAVNGSRQSYLPANSLITGCEHEEQTDLALPLGRRQRLKRKSSELFPHRRKLRWDDKENVMRSTSTPLHGNSHCTTDTSSQIIADNISPLRNLESFKDLSNILLENIASTPTPKTPEQKPRVPRQYASTLPTFDVEYSPNSLIPGPILAMRGLGIPDSYFEKPRYLTQADLEAHLEKRAAANNIENKTCDQHKINYARYARQNKIKTNVTKSKIIEPPEEESSLSSSKMGDMTLDRMIDAILESTRKERKLSRCAHLRHVPPPSMSPTYTPAEDPASDLHEYWDQASAQYLPNHYNTATTTITKTASPTKTILHFNEREVRDSPSLVERLRQSQNYHLNRQRAVRRKRKLGKINKTTRSSAHKQALSVVLNSSVELSAVVKKTFVPPTPLPAPSTPTARSNISPDSGHNSTSELENSPEGDITLQAVGDNLLDVVDITKKRLSFTHDQSKNNNNTADLS